MITIQCIGLLSHSYQAITIITCSDSLIREIVCGKWTDC